jgi:hypothetical protein
MAKSSLYSKSVAAMKRYFKSTQPAKTRLGKAIDLTQRENFRAGWCRGYAAGFDACKRSTPGEIDE